MASDDHAKVEHHLIDNTLFIEEAGVLAKCTCGWVSRPYFSGTSANLAFREHQESERDE